MYYNMDIILCGSLYGSVYVVADVVVHMIVYNITVACATNYDRGSLYVVPSFPQSLFTP